LSGNDFAGRAVSSLPVHSQPKASPVPGYKISLTVVRRVE